MINQEDGVTSSTAPNKKKIGDDNKNATKADTKMYATEKPKSNGLSAATVCNFVDDKYGTSINKYQVQKLVQQGIIGETPPKKGPDGGIPFHHFKHLVGAFETYVQVKQVNGEGGSLM